MRKLYAAQTISDSSLPILRCKFAIAAILYGCRNSLANKTREIIINRQSILILDFGSQYTQLIARRIRELSVYCEIAPFSRALEQIAEMKPAGIVLSGGLILSAGIRAHMCQPNYSLWESRSWESVMGSS